MENLVDNKFTWVIKNFLFLQSVKIYSDEFVIDGCKWRVLAYPRGNGNGGKQHLSLYLAVSGSEFLPVGWRRNAKFYICVVNQLYEPYSLAKETQHCFDASASDWGFTSMIALNELHEKNSGYLVDGELKIVVQVSVLEVIVAKDVTEKSAKKFKALIKREENEALIKREENDVVESNNLLKDASSVKEFIDVNGFRVLPSQAESVRCIFKRHPNIATEFRPKNQHLRSAYMNVLLSLISTMCQSTLELSNDDLTDAYATLAYLTAAGLNLKWLEEKLDEVSKKKEIEENGEKRIQGIEQELKELKEKRSNLKAELEKEIADVYVARAPLTFDDVV